MKFKSHKNSDQNFISIEIIESIGIQKQKDDANSIQKQIV